MEFGEKTGCCTDESIPMLKFQVICPECRAAVVTSHPEALVWEHCPGCGRHVWDRYDALMADVVADRNPLNGMGDHAMRGGVRDNN
jgi:hypothetical protein